MCLTTNKMSIKTCLEKEKLIKLINTLRLVRKND